MRPINNFRMSYHGNILFALRIREAVGGLRLFLPLSFLRWGWVLFSGSASCLLVSGCKERRIGSELILASRLMSFFLWAWECRWTGLHRWDWLFSNRFWCSFLPFRVACLSPQARHPVLFWSMGLQREASVLCHFLDCKPANLWKFGPLLLAQGTAVGLRWRLSLCLLLIDEHFIGLSRLPICLPIVCVRFWVAGCMSGVVASYMP